MLSHTNRRISEVAKKATINQYKYDSSHCRTFRMKLNLTIDADIIKKLTSEPSMQGYIKQLIRDDIARTQIKNRYTCEHCANNTEETEDGMIVCHNDGQKKQKDDTCDQWY